MSPSFGNNFLTLFGLMVLDDEERRKKKNLMMRKMTISLPMWMMSLNIMKIQKMRKKTMLLMKMAIDILALFQTGKNKHFPVDGDSLQLNDDRLNS